MKQKGDFKAIKKILNFFLFQGLSLEDIEDYYRGVVPEKKTEKNSV